MSNKTYKAKIISSLLKINNYQKETPIKQLDNGHKIGQRNQRDSKKQRHKETQSPPWIRHHIGMEESPSVIDKHWVSWAPLPTAQWTSEAQVHYIRSKPHTHKHRCGTNSNVRCYPSFHINHGPNSLPRPSLSSQKASHLGSRVRRPVKGGVGLRSEERKQANETLAYP